jgi:hypothetical protein
VCQIHVGDAVLPATRKIGFWGEMGLSAKMRRFTKGAVWAKG